MSAITIFVVIILQRELRLSLFKVLREEIVTHQAYFFHLFLPRSKLLIIFHLLIAYSATGYWASCFVCMIVAQCCFDDFARFQ
jgi:hypothetical protein